MIGSRIGHALDPLVLAVYRMIFRGRVRNPNTFTVCGFLLGVASFAFIASGRPIIGGLALFVSGFLDLLDGAIARTSGRVTPFGGFLDSVLDRYTDLLVMCGILIVSVRGGSLFYIVSTFVASIGIAVIPYARARAEAAAFECKTGFMERPERLVLLLIGLFFGLLPYVIVILAVLTHLTVIQRILFVRKAAAGRAQSGGG